MFLPRPLNSYNPNRYANGWAYGVATDKVIAINRKAAPPDESAAAALVGVLAKAFEGKSVTVTEADPVEQAVEVEATSE